MRLWNLEQRIEPPERRFSRVFKGRGELIDHILVSHCLVQRVDSVDTSSPTLPSIGETPPGTSYDEPSDHAAVGALRPRLTPQSPRTRTGDRHTDLAVANRPMRQPTGCRAQRPAESQRRTRELTRR